MMPSGSFGSTAARPRRRGPIPSGRGFPRPGPIPGASCPADASTGLLLRLIGIRRLHAMIPAARGWPGPPGVRPIRIKITES